AGGFETRQDTGSDEAGEAARSVEKIFWRLHYRRRISRNLVQLSDGTENREVHQTQLRQRLRAKAVLRTVISAALPARRSALSRRRRNRGVSCDPAARQAFSAVRDSPAKLARSDRRP